MWLSHAEPLIGANLMHTHPGTSEVVLLSVTFLALCATDPRPARSIRLQKLVSRPKCTSNEVNILDLELWPLYDVSLH